MLLKFRNVEFNAKTITYGRNNKPAEADFLGIDSDSQDSKLTDKDYFDTYISMAGIKSDVKKPDVSAEASDQIYQNGKASEELINQEAIIEAVDEAVYHKEYKNAADLLETIETLIDTALTVAVATDNREIQTQINNILNIGVGLIKQKHVVNTMVKSYNKSFPACVIAHRLYGSDNLEARAADIQTRNGIANALFMPAGVDLEVEEA